MHGRGARPGGDLHHGLFVPRPEPRRGARASFGDRLAGWICQLRETLAGRIAKELILMRSSGQKILLACGGLVLCVCGVGCGHDDVEPLAAQTGPKIVPVTVAKAERRTVETTVDVVGSLK